ncbi:probable 4-coumarate--CoA ligase 1 [Ochlerotatus camptorhynchus]|uniref:probable 4-coumarate--CoA ligase 1 n=1 Tax=Ochlerotatus camptorhynchus TaxID=644619 RepID=UPI0031D45529
MCPLKNVYTFYDPSTKIWSGLPRKPIFNPQQGIGDLILQILERNADKVVQISADSGVEVTGAEMRLRTIRIAQNLIRMGYGSGRHSEDIFTMIVRNGEYTAPVLFACFALGIPVNTLDPSFQRDDLSHMLETVQPKLVFCESEILEELIAACDLANVSPKIIVTEDHIDGYDHVKSLLESTGNEAAFVSVPIANPTVQLAVLLCSSGTTGRSKAVCLSHSICIAHLANFFQCNPSDRTLAFSTLYWLSGMFTLLTSTAWGATRIITRQTYDAELTLEIIERFRVSAVVLPSSQALGVVNSPNANVKALRSLRFSFTGGSMIPVSLKRSFEQLIPGRFLEVVYGFSEIALAVTFTREEFYRDGSVGFPVAGTEFKIVDDDGQALEVDQEGEILVRAEYVFGGYFGNEDATRQILDSEGWLHSGDIGRFDEDGYLYVVDRKKDIIKCSGFQVSPSEIESVIQEMPGVAAVCVVGIPAEVFDLATALVVRKGSVESEVPDSAEIARKVEEALPWYKHLKGGVYLTNELPLTPSGKVMRRSVRDIVLRIKDGKGKEN